MTGTFDIVATLAQRQKPNKLDRGFNGNRCDASLVAKLAGS
jgi:hypothetical protein